MVFYRRTSVVRCPEAREDSFYVPSAGDDGDCKIEESLFDDPVDENGKGLIELGRFRATCRIYGADGVLCAGTVLTASGSIYRQDVYSTTAQLPDVEGLEECYDDQRRTSASVNMTRAAAAGPSHVKAKPKARGHFTQSFYKGQAEIMTGPMFITSMDKPFAYTSAWFQYVRFVSVPADTPATSVVPAGVQVVTPFTYNLVFAKPSSSGMQHLTHVVSDIVSGIVNTTAPSPSSGDTAVEEEASDEAYYEPSYDVYV